MKHSPRTLAALAVVLLASSADAQGAQLLERFDVSSGVNGALGTPICVGDETIRPGPFARTAANLRGEGLLLDTGGLLAGGGVVRFATEHQPEALAQLVRDLGYDLLALGEADLADRPALLLARLQALRSVGIPVLATNLRCDASQPLCSHVSTAADGLARTPTGTVFLSVIDPGALLRIAPDRRQGLTLLPIRDTLQTAVRDARAGGAETVVAIVDGGIGAEAFSHIVDVLSGLDDVEKPDVVLSAGGGSALLFARPASMRPAFVGAPPGGALRVQVRRRDERFDVFATPVASGDVPPAMSRFIEALGVDYCSEFGRALEGGTLDRDMDPSALAELLASVIRSQHDADLGIVNEGLVDRRWRGSGSLRYADLQVAIAYDEPIVRFSVPGTWLRTLARDTPSGLHVPGLEISGAGTTLERIKVHGRPLELTASYEIATLRYLADGGDAALPPIRSTVRPTEQTLRESAAAYLSQAREGDPRDNLDDPADAFEWSTQLAASLSFTGNAVRDRSGYQEGPLANPSQTQIGLSANVRFNGTSRNAAWQNEITATYSLARTQDSDGFEEGGDQLTYRTSAQLRSFRRRIDAFYVPDLIVEGFLRTEFTPEAPDHFLNLRFVGGPQFRLLPKVTLRLVGGLEIVNAASPERRAEPGAGAQLAVLSLPLIVDLPRRLVLDASVDYFASGLGSEVRHLVQGNFAFQLNLSQAFGLDFNVTMYGLKEGEGSFAFAIGTSASLRVNWSERWLGG